MTYRLWDYGRARELHLVEATRIADLGVNPGPVVNGVVRSKYFVTDPVRLSPGEERTPEPRRCQLWICLEGRGTIGGEPFRQGEVWLMPETDEQPLIRTDTGAHFLRTYVP